MNTEVLEKSEVKEAIDKVEVVVEKEITEENLLASLVRKQKFEDFIKKYVQNNEIAKERKDENSMIKEDVANFLGESENRMVIELDNGMFAVINKRYSVREVLDKDALAMHLGISKDEIKTPYDFAKLTEKGTINSELIAKFTDEVKKPVVSIRVVKNNPDKKKKKKFPKKSL